MPKRFSDRANIRFLPGMLVRLDAVLKPGEDRTTFILAVTAAPLRKAEAIKDKKAAMGRAITCSHEPVSSPTAACRDDASLT